ncbi:hypothetical protein C7M51_02985 [Mixta intestinalis]|uniref:Uncharacterized protein n=1 Tax=Mixta intestinalis TaxID=1615494 RepID=A0A6P1Q3N6_9GAMM|nr:hypothetical protein C7M51_02985 [Mixta intestinalis]
MSQHLYTSISVSRCWQNAAKLTEQKVRCEREAEICCGQMTSEVALKHYSDFIHVSVLLNSTGDYLYWK